MKHTKFMDGGTLPMPSTTRTVNNRAMVYQGTRHSVSEWHILRAAHPNLLITGVPDAVEQSLEALTPHLVPSVWYWPLGASWPSPGGMRTLVIRDVQRLALADQQALSLWFDQGASMQTRVVSTATVPLLQLVEAGLFMDALYYRLNVLTWATKVGPARGRPRP
jgi:sigma-54-interacting transcriptional regulator